mgnify:CR=1 FL=1
MPSNDDMKHQNEEATKSSASVDAPAESVLPDVHATGTVETSAVPLSSDQNMPHEFTFFQKKKRAVQAVLAPSVAYASTAQLAAFATRLDSAAKVNVKIQRHIAELMTLTSDVARTTTADISMPTRKRLPRPKWLFYGCLVGFGAGWFLLFPTGHSLITQLTAFLAR